MTMSIHDESSEDTLEFNDGSLQRHGISRLEAMQVVEADESEYFPLSPNEGNDRVMFVGFAHAEVRLLEVGVEFLADGRERIFHAGKARRYFVNLYNQRKHHEIEI